MQDGAREDDADDGSDDDSQYVEAGDDGGCCRSEESQAKDDVDGQARGTGHQRHEQAGQEALVAVLQCARGVDRRHRTAKAQDHGHEGLAMETREAHHAIHHEGHPGHVAAVLEERQEQVQHREPGDEDEHRPDAGDDTVDGQRDEPVRRGEHGQQRGDPARDGSTDDRIHPVEEERRDVHHQLEDREHDHEEDGQTEDPVGEDLVEPVRGAVAADRGGVHDLARHAVHVAVASVRDGDVGAVPEQRIRSRERASSAWLRMSRPASASATRATRSASPSNSLMASQRGW